MAQCAWQQGGRAVESLLHALGVTIGYGPTAVALDPALLQLFAQLWSRAAQQVRRAGIKHWPQQRSMLCLQLKRAEACYLLACTQLHVLHSLLICSHLSLRRLECAKGCGCESCRLLEEHRTWLGSLHPTTFWMLACNSVAG